MCCYYGVIAFVYILCVSHVCTQWTNSDHRRRGCIDGNLHLRDKAIWHTDPCKICSCENGIKFCQTTQCSHTKCLKSEVLQIPANNCCPECVPASKSCTYKGQSYMVNTEWSSRKCQVCKCLDSKVVCAKNVCPQLKCPAGQNKQMLPKNCCPSCIPTGRTCHYYGQTYLDGVDWSPIACTRCRCRNGMVTCYVQQCPKLICNKNQVLKRGTCCPQCQSPTCKVNGNNIQDGFQWLKDTCTRCICRQGNTVCLKQQCRRVSCKRNQKRVRRPGHCCPSCVPVGDRCSYQGHIYYHGDIWNISKCQFCSCDKGRVSCQKVTCGHVTCQPNQQKVIPPGRCCPECITPPTCLNNSNEYQEGETWHPSPCTLCRCTDGTEQCYSKQCVVCRSHGNSNQCCGTCTKGCSSNCVKCSSQGQCELCNNNFYLKYGQCVKACGVGFSAETGSCSAISKLSENFIKRPLQYTAEKPTVLDDNVIDTSNLRHQVTLLQAPSSGQFVIIRHSVEKVMSVGSNFTVADIVAGRIIYVPKTASSVQDKAVFQVRDSRHKSTVHTLFINHQDTSSLKLLKSLPLVVEVGSSVIIGSQALAIQGSANTMARILQGPLHGQFIKSNQTISNFALSDLKAGFISYRHGGSSKMADMAVIQLVEKDTILNVFINIEVKQKGDQRPVLLVNLELLAAWKGMTPITKEVLYAEKNNMTDENLIYTLKPPSSNPSQGEIVMVVAVPKGGANKGWIPLKDGRMMAKMYRFLQRDINERRIWYRHLGLDSSTLTDSLSFEISDRGNPPNVLEDQNLQVSIARPQRDEALPTLAPGVKLGMTIYENQMMPIASANLAFTDIDSDDKDILYTITRPLLANQGTVEHINKPFKSIHQFTQEDINMNRIIYRPPMKKIGLKEKQFTFWFIVQDSVTGKTLPEDMFTIQVSPVNDIPPKLANNNTVLRLSQGGSVSLGPKVIQVIDPDTDMQDIELTLIESPNSGSVLKAHKGTRVILRTGDKFMYTEVLQNVFLYVHDGTASSQDAVKFSISDGIHNIVMAIRFEVEKVDVSSPVKVPSATMFISVKEGGTVLIDRGTMAFKDLDSNDNDIKITLFKKPQHGLLMHNANAIESGMSFTQKQVNFKLIRYTADKEIGTTAITESLYFNVTDANKNVLPRQLLTVAIAPTNNQAPTVYVGSDVQVTEGGRVQLTLSDLSATDVDSTVSVLRVIIDSPPTFGVLENLKADPRSESLKRNHVTSFSVQDIIVGHIFYVQSDHLNKEPIADNFLFHVTDGTNDSPSYRFNISIQLTNDEPPTVITEQIFTKEDSGILVTNATIYVHDLDTPHEELEFTLDQAPIYGNLRRKDFVQDMMFAAIVLKRGDIFSYEDVIDNKIVYTHNGNEVAGDTFMISLTDGNHTVTKTMHVVVHLMDNETPRVKINRGLELPAGSSAVIRPESLKATDLDSDDTQLKYTVTTSVSPGVLQKVATSGRALNLTVGDYFLQKDLNAGRIKYVHSAGEAAGTALMRFSVEDPRGNKLIAQSFVITITEDRSPPSILANKELTVREGGSAKLTTAFLSFTDSDSEPGDLRYNIMSRPVLGILEKVANKGVPVSTFTQADIASNSIQYVHMSEQEVYMDSFTFSVSDGTNQVIQKFHIAIQPVDDSLPVVVSNGLTVQEGVRKLMTEFDLKATDKDTEENSVMFVIVQSPAHGSIDQLKVDKYVRTSQFSMKDIYENRISYNHDGTETKKDSFIFKVSDGTNTRYITQSDGRETPTKKPTLFTINILPVDDGSPILVTNIGLNYLEYVKGQAMNLITQQELKATDIDTENKKLMFHMKILPKYGILVNTADPKRPLSVFSQEDINNGVLRYILTNQNAINSTHDQFTFDLIDSRPNTVSGMVFHIRWTYTTFEEAEYNITETSTVINIPVKRCGNLKQYSIVTCATKPISATSVSDASRPGSYDYVQHVGQVQFDEWQEHKTCTIIVNDDSVYEGPETFHVQLSNHAYTLPGDITTTAITIYDTEDEPKIQFERAIFSVNETDGHLYASLVRTGDISISVSVVCYTQSLSAIGSSLSSLQSGSDYKSRGRGNDTLSRVVFPAGITKATCDVQLIDDSIYEGKEQFQLRLVEPSHRASIGTRSRAVVSIEGPNDESVISLATDVFYVDENSGAVDIPVLRSGSDLTHSSMVWCVTRLTEPPSATPGQDYVPSSSQISFGPMEDVQKCHLVILDDTADPRVEGNETLTIFLTSSMGSVLGGPNSATVIINDTDLDVPKMQFEKASYTVDEKDGKIEVAITRTGDISYESSVICYTRQLSAQVMIDFDERVWMEESRITFYPGEKIKNCTVNIFDDTINEAEETFTLKLDGAVGSYSCGAAIGNLDFVTITITNPDDAPTIQIKETSYSVNEPSSGGKVTSLDVTITRSGDNSRLATVRVSTRDGSAISGFDYSPKSKIVKFKPGIRQKTFNVAILYNADVEWHETFSVVLGPDLPVNAIFGDVAVATVTILDHEVSGSLVLPAAPVVVSLLDYDNVEVGLEERPSPGYPIVCVTPCDVHYPSYGITGSICESSGLNQTDIFYAWEVAMPTDLDGSRSPFVKVTDATLFTNVDHMVLDSIYFRPNFQVRCVAQPGHGVPLRSNIVTIGITNGICHTPITAGNPHGFKAQSFRAELQYVDPSDKHNPNTVHISMKIPHQDGMLPLLSTLPLHNLKFLLSHPVYRQQHICSNMITLGREYNKGDHSFSSLNNITDVLGGLGYSFPYQLDSRLREPETVHLYKHLNLKACQWTFNAYYHMTELVDLCGGKVIPNFKVRDSAQSYLSVVVPLYVSYVYVLAPTGWGSMEHQTDMTFSFYYNTVLWRTGLETEGKLGGRIQILKIVIGKDGQLVVDFKTQAKFRGQYLMEHYTLDGYKSHVIPPAGIKITFDLALMWSEQTFDSPTQLWRATSLYNLKDYSGSYTIELIPCTVEPTQSYVANKDTPVVCTAHPPASFTVPISFQQTNRPVPLKYSLNTEFQLTNNLKLFLLDPSKSDIQLSDMDYGGTFSHGQTIYGRVLWDPKQNLNNAYRLRIEKVYICAGKDGYVPTYDPSGDIYHEGKQYGCIQHSRRLEHRFLILDRTDLDAAVKAFNEVPFNAVLCANNPYYASLSIIPGIDGFSISVDPLYKTASGHQWFLQVLYSIGAEDRGHRYQRSVGMTFSRLTKRDIRYTKDSDIKYTNGTNMKLLYLNVTDSDMTYERFDEKVTKIGTVSIIGAVLGIVVVVVLIIAIVILLHRRKSRRKGQEHTIQTNNVAHKNINIKENHIENIYNDFQKQKHLNIRHVNITKKNNMEKNAKVRHGGKATEINVNTRDVNIGSCGTEV